MNRCVLSLLLGVSFLPMKEAYAMDGIDLGENREAGTNTLRLATTPGGERSAEEAAALAQSANGVSAAVAAGVAAPVAMLTQDSVAARSDVQFDLGGGDWKSPEGESVAAALLSPAGVAGTATAGAKLKLYDTLSPEHKAAIDRFFDGEEPVFEEASPAVAGSEMGGGSPKVIAAAAAPAQSVEDVRGMVAAGAGATVAQAPEQTGVQVVDLALIPGRDGKIGRLIGKKSGKIATTVRLGPGGMRFLLSKEFGLPSDWIRASLHCFMEKDAAVTICIPCIEDVANVKSMFGPGEYKDELVKRVKRREEKVIPCFRNNDRNKPAAFTIFSPGSCLYIGERDLVIDFDQRIERSPVQPLGDISGGAVQIPAAAPSRGPNAMAAAGAGAGAGGSSNGLSTYKTKVLRVLDSVFQNPNTEASSLPSGLWRTIIAYVPETIKIPTLKGLRDSISIKLIRRKLYLPLELQSHLSTLGIGDRPEYKMADSHEYQISVVIDGERRACLRNFQPNKRTFKDKDAKPTSFILGNFLVKINKKSGLVGLYFEFAFDWKGNLHEANGIVPLTTMPMRYDPHLRYLFEDSRGHQGTIAEDDSEW